MTTLLASKARLKLSDAGRENPVGVGDSSVKRTATWLALAAASVVTLLPFAWLIVSSFKLNDEFFQSMFLPMKEGGGWGVAWEKLTGANYERLFRELDFARSLLNSIFLASVTGVIATLLCAMGGYALAKFDFRGRKWCTALVLGAVLIPPPLLIAPGYQLLYNLNMLDTFAGLILPALAPAFGVFLFRQSMLSSVPTELIEAARIDGAGEMGVFFSIVLPLVRPMIGTFMMITFLAVWNNYISPQVVLQTPSKFPLSVAVAQLRGVYYQEYGLQMAGTVVSIVPVLVLFMLLQKEFVSGLTSGAVKG